MPLTETQRARWERTRAKGRPRVLLEQALVWTVAVGVGGPTLRAAVRGGRGAVEAYWTGGAALSHIVLAFVLGAVMTCVFGVLSWSRMERLYAESTRTSR